MASEAVAPGDVQVDGVLDGWGETHEREQLFQKKKMQKRKVEAYVAGALVAGEIDDEVMADAAAALGKEAKNAEKRRRTGERKAMLRSGSTLPNADQMREQPVFVDGNFDAATTTLIEAKILQLKMAKVAKRTKAAFYVCQDPGNPGTRTASPWQSWGNPPAANMMREGPAEGGVVCIDNIRGFTQICAIANCVP